jgi:hypothetical protein
MACCGRGKRKPAKPNGKVCPRCGWVMNRVHKYDTNQRKVVRYFLCSNKHRKPGGGGACSYKEPIK